VLTLPYELRRLAAFKADVLTALAGIFVDAVFARYRARARREGIADPQCGSVNFVQRFGSLNLHVHFHLLVLDGVFARDAQGRAAFYSAAAPTVAELDAAVARTSRRAIAWLRKRGFLDEDRLGAGFGVPTEQTALDACAAIAMGRGSVATLPRDGARDDAHGATEERPDRPALAVERDGFNIHAGVRIEAGDDLGRERLARYGARPPLSLERLRRLPGGRVSYRLKYVDRGRRGKHRVMSGLEFMARLAAIIAPPRYPLVRYGGVLAPRSAWRREVVPRPRERRDPCDATPASRPPSVDRGPARDAAGRATPHADAATGDRRVEVPDVARRTASVALVGPARSADVVGLAPNVISVRHWDRLLGGLLYAVSPRVDWATLLRRSFDVDVLQCPKCQGRLRVVAVITERDAVRRILSHLGEPTEAPPLARARDPTDEQDDVGSDSQLGLGLA